MILGLFPAIGYINEFAVAIIEQVFLWPCFFVFRLGDLS